jgi:RNA polymerase sigma-70 factor (ECF subfamily)
MYDSTMMREEHEMVVEDRDTALLVARFQAGDREAMAALYLRYFERVYGYARLLLRDRDRAETVAQQVFLRVIEALPRYRDTGKPFRSWLFRIARNCAIDELDEARRVELRDPAALAAEIEGMTNGESIAVPSIGWITDDELMLFIERLPLAQRQILMLSYMLDLDNAEIGRVLGHSPDTVRRYKNRALAFLRKRLSAVGREQARSEKAQPALQIFRQNRVTRARRWQLQKPGPTG